MKHLNLTLDVDVEATDSDEVLREKAAKHRDEAIRKAAEAAAALAWDQATKSKLGKPNGTKSEFVRKAAAEAVRKATTRERDEAEKELFRLFKEDRDRKAR